MSDTETPTCFVVDDDRDLRRLISHSARKSGMEIVECASVDEVRTALETVHPHLVFLDLGLGNGGGEQVMEALAARGCDGWVQLVSGRSLEALEAVEEAGEDLGLSMLPSLTKPFRAGAIREIVESFGARRPEAAQ